MSVDAGQIRSAPLVIQLHGGRERLAKSGLSVIAIN
jgi:hypothetical protein